MASSANFARGESLRRGYVEDIDEEQFSRSIALSNESTEKDDHRPEDYSLLSCFPGYSEFKENLHEYAREKGLYPKLRQLVHVLLGLAYGAYFIAALSVVSDLDKTDYWCQGDGLLLVLTGSTAVLVIYFLGIKEFCGREKCRCLLESCDELLTTLWQRQSTRWFVYSALVFAVVVFLIFDTYGDRQRLQSLVGLFLLLFLGFIFSFAPRKIIWRQVVCALALQFLLGLLVLRWPVGRKIFECTGEKISKLLGFTGHGTSFVFGTLVTDMSVFAFKILPTILFFSFLVQVLYYYGVIQWVVIKLGWLLQVVIGTTPCESVTVAANIFLGMTESPLLIRPFIPLLTQSELHSIMAGGFATIAGSVMAAFISFGVSAPHLLAASVMSAPAALACAKLLYPEVEVSRTAADEMEMVKSPECNALHAGIEGVIAALPMLANIVAGLICFIAFIAFFNAIFDWCCITVGADEGVCTLQNVFGYIFMPLAWCMGVPWSECHVVGTLIGLKTIINEFVAYSVLAGMIAEGTLSKRAQIIATYALCGFSNIGSIGIQLGNLSALVPSRRADIAKIAVRAMVAGSAACFMTACVAGVLLDDSSSVTAVNVAADV